MWIEGERKEEKHRHPQFPESALVELRISIRQISTLADGVPQTDTPAGGSRSSQPSHEGQF